MDICSMANAPVFDISMRFSEFAILAVLKAGSRNQPAAPTYAGALSPPDDKSHYRVFRFKMNSIKSGLLITRSLVQAALYGWLHVALGSVTSRTKWWGYRRHPASTRTLSLYATTRREHTRSDVVRVSVSLMTETELHQKPVNLCRV